MNFLLFIFFFVYVCTVLGLRHADGEGAKIPQGGRQQPRSTDGLHCWRGQGVLQGKGSVDKFEWQTCCAGTFEKIASCLQDFVPCLQRARMTAHPY